MNEESGRSIKDEVTVWRIKRPCGILHGWERNDTRE